MRSRCMNLKVRYSFTLYVIIDLSQLNGQVSFDEIPRRNYEKGFPTFLSQKKGKVTKNCVRSPNSKVWLLWPKKSNLVQYSPYVRENIFIFIASIISVAYFKNRSKISQLMYPFDAMSSLYIISRPKKFRCSCSLEKKNPFFEFLLPSNLIFVNAYLK